MCWRCHRCEAPLLCLTWACLGGAGAARAQADLGGCVMRSSAPRRLKRSQEQTGESTSAPETTAEAETEAEAETSSLNMCSSVCSAGSS